MPISVKYSNEQLLEETNKEDMRTIITRHGNMTQKSPAP